MDPLTKKYPWYTPYSFSGNRLMDAIELEGLEEYLIFFPPRGDNRTASDFSMIKTSIKLMEKVDDQAFRTFGHSSPEHLEAYAQNGNIVKLKTANQLDNFITESGHKDAWNDLKQKGGTYIAYSCDAGDEGGVLQKLSKKYPKLIVIGATEYVRFWPGGDTVRVTTTVDKNNKPLDHGVWNIYQNGEIIDTKPFDWQPTEIDPTTLKKPEKKSFFDKVIDFFSDNKSIKIDKAKNDKPKDSENSKN